MIARSIGTIWMAVLGVWIGAGFWSPDDSRVQVLAAEAPSSLGLEPLYRTVLSDGQQRCLTWDQVALYKLEGGVDGIAFYAVISKEWPGGLVPVFEVEKTNRFELRRRPPRGKENEFEPHFMGWPSPDETEVTRVAGRWHCEAIRGDGSKAFLGWDLSVERGLVSGRFLQNTDYRIASILGGTIQSNRLEFRVEYVSDAYTVTGQWQEGRWKGDWGHVQGDEHGTWETFREEVVLPRSDGVVGLYEWQDGAGDGRRRYEVEGITPGSGWVRSQRPLCFVWKGPDP